MKKLIILILIHFGFSIPATDAFAQIHADEVRAGVGYSSHDGIQLVSDLYASKAPGRYFAVVAVNGGWWQSGSAEFYMNWEVYLAQWKYVLFFIEYRLSKEKVKRYSG